MRRLHLLGMISPEPPERVRISNDLKRLLIEMEERGYLLFAERSKERIKYEGDMQNEWEIATLIVKKMNNEESLQF